MFQVIYCVLWVAASIRFSSAIGQTNFHLAARAYGKYFGTATNVEALADPAYTVTLSSNAVFGQLTPENEMKWVNIEPQHGVFDFDPADQVVAQAKAHGQILRCHTLVWGDGLPDWVIDYRGPAHALAGMIWRHVFTVVSHFKNDCYAWDVVNEALNNDGTYRQNVFLDALGPQYIAIAFEAAAMADPDAKLYYNDYNIDNDYSVAPEYPIARHRHRKQRRDVSTLAKVQAVINLVDMVRSHGAHIDGIGLEGHYACNYTPTVETLVTIMNKFTDMDLDVAVTELDVRMDLGKINAYTEAMQAQGFANVIIACRNVERCVGVTLWGFTDKYSWVPYIYPSEGSADPWDCDLVPKAEIQEAIEQAWVSGYYGSYIA